MNKQYVAMLAVVAGVSAGLLSGCGGALGTDTLAKAAKQIDQRDKRSAVVTLKSALQSRPDDPALRFLLGKTLLEMGDPVPAVVELRKSLELGHPEADVVPQLVRGLTAIGKQDEALKLFATKTFTDKKAMAELQTGLAAAWGASGKVDQMQAAIEQALVSDPTHATANTVKATFLAGQGKPEEALALLNAVLQRDPAFATALHYKGMLQRYHLKDVAAATATQREALKAEPALLSAHAELLSIFYAAKDKEAMRKQIADMQRALPRHLSTALYKAQLEFMEGNVRVARELVQQMLRTKEPDHRVLLLAAHIEYQNGSLTLAETYLTRALNAKPRLDSARIMMAQVLTRLGQTEKALVTLQPLLAVDSPSIDALSVAAEAYLYGGNMNQAQNFFERASRLNPTDSRLQTAIALQRIAQGRVAEGLSDLHRVAETDSGTFADLALIATLLRRQDVDGALKAVDQLEKKDLKAPLAPFLRGQLQQARNQIDAARASFARALEVDPRYFAAARALAAMDMQANNLPAAKKHFETILARDPGNFRSLLALADLKSRSRDPEEQVIALLEEAVKRNPTELEARGALIEYYLVTGAHKKALQAGQDALSAMPDNPQLLYAMGRAQFGVKEYQQAISSFRKVTALVPKSAQAHLSLADVHAARDEKSAAVASLQRALELQPDLLPAQARQIRYLLDEKKYKEALVIARKVQKSRPKDGVGHMYEAGVHMETKQWEPALAALRTSLDRGPSTKAATLMHEVLLELGKPAEAARFATEWRSKYPKDHIFLFHLGSMAMRRNDWAAAESVFREIIAATPDHTTSNNNLAQILLIQKKPGALPFAEKAAKLAPKSAAVLDTLASALADAGELRKALELQRKVVSMAPNMLDARLNLARIAIQAGDKALAKAELEKLAYEGAKFPRQAEASDLLKQLQ